MNLGSCNNCDCKDVIQQVEKVESKERLCDQNKSSKNDLDVALKHQWKVIRQRPSKVKDSAYQYRNEASCVDDEVGDVPAFSAVDMKLHWEEHRLPVNLSSSRPPSRLFRFFPRPTNERTAHNHRRSRGSRSNDEQVRPGAFFIPGLHDRMDDDVINDGDDPALALAIEVSEDRERQLELYLEHIKRQNEALVRTLQDTDFAHVIPEHMLRSGSTSTTSSSFFQHTKHERIVASGCIFAAVLGFATILLLTILIVTYDAPGTVTRANITSVSNVTVIYNVTERIKANWIAGAPLSIAPQDNWITRAPVSTASQANRITRQPVVTAPQANPIIPHPVSTEPHSPSPEPFVELLFMPTMEPIEIQTAIKLSTSLPTIKKQSEEAFATSAIATSAPAVASIQTDTIKPTLRPTMRPEIQLTSWTPQMDIGTNTTVGPSLKPTIVSQPKSILTEYPSSLPSAQPTVGIRISIAYSPSSTPLETNCTEQFSDYTICLSSVQQLEGDISCDECLGDALDEATVQTSCAWFQQNFCSVYQGCQEYCQWCATQVQALTTCLAPTDCLMDCFDAMATLIPSLTLLPTLVETITSTLVPSSSTMVFDNKDDLTVAIDQYVVESTGMPPIGSWDVSLVTDMSYLFDIVRNPKLREFNEDISDWNVSNVTDMSYMFRSSEWIDGDYIFGAINPDLSSWDVSNVRSMKGMFYGSNKFDGDISSWDVSNVVDMSFMFHGPYFRGPHSFNTDISSWNTGKVTDMSRMFFYSSFNGDLSQWDVSNVVCMETMFAHSSFNGDISAWDVSSVTDTTNMFGGFWEFSFTQFDQDISSWNVAKVTSMRYMFWNNPQFNQDLSSWDVSRVTSMEAMFESSIAFNGDISSWNVANVQSMLRMFQGAESFNRDISSWDVSGVTDMNGMFLGSLFNQDISSWNVSQVQDVTFMFSSTPLNQNLCQWGSLLSSTAPKDNMFTRTSCPVETSPDMTTSPPSPFCYPCI